MAAKEKNSSKSANDLWQAPEVRAAVACLPRLVSVWPSELDDLAGANYDRLIARLRKALRAERQRGIAGHWTYDLARHAELLAVYRLLLSAHCRGRLSQASSGTRMHSQTTPAAVPPGRKQNGPAR